MSNGHRRLSGSDPHSGVTSVGDPPDHLQTDDTARGITYRPTRSQRAVPLRVIRSRAQPHSHNLNHEMNELIMRFDAIEDLTSPFYSISSHLEDSFLMTRVHRIRQIVQTIPPTSLITLGVAADLVENFHDYNYKLVNSAIYRLEIQRNISLRGFLHSFQQQLAILNHFPGIVETIRRTRFERDAATARREGEEFLRSQDDWVGSITPNPNNPSSTIIVGEVHGPWRVVQINRRRGFIIALNTAAQDASNSMCQMTFENWWLHRAFAHTFDNLLESSLIQFIYGIVKGFGEAAEQTVYPLFHLQETFTNLVNGLKQCFEFCLRHFQSSVTSPIQEIRWQIRTVEQLFTKCYDWMEELISSPDLARRIGEIIGQIIFFFVSLGVGILEYIGWFERFIAAIDGKSFQELLALARSGISTASRSFARSIDSLFAELSVTLPRLRRRLQGIMNRLFRYETISEQEMARLLQSTPNRGRITTILENIAQPQHASHNATSLIDALVSAEIFIGDGYTIASTAEGEVILNGSTGRRTRINSSNQHLEFFLEEGEIQNGAYHSQNSYSLEINDAPSRRLDDSHPHHTGPESNLSPIDNPIDNPHHVTGSSPPTRTTQALEDERIAQPNHESSRLNNDLDDPFPEYSGDSPTYPSSSRTEVLTREVFSVERLRDIQASFDLISERLNVGIQRVTRRLRNSRLDNRLSVIQREIERLQNSHPIGAGVMAQSTRERAISLLTEARSLARERWGQLQPRVWRELFQDPEMVGLFEMLSRDGIVELPRGFPNTSSAPRLISQNRDSLIWRHIQEGFSVEDVTNDLNVSQGFVENKLSQLRRRQLINNLSHQGRTIDEIARELRSSPERVRRLIEQGFPPPEQLRLPINLDHITPIESNPFRYFDPDNLRAINASYNDTWLRIYQSRVFPMTDDPLETWIRAFQLVRRSRG